MSVFVFNGVGTPNTPATGKTAIYVDSTDGRLKSKDSTGTISILQANGFDDKNGQMQAGQQYKRVVGGPPVQDKPAAAQPPKS